MDKAKRIILMVLGTGALVGSFLLFSLQSSSVEAKNTDAIAATDNLNPTEDDYANISDTPAELAAENFMLITGSGVSCTEQRLAYLKFNVDAITSDDISSATLTIRSTADSPDNPTLLAMDLYGGIDDSWAASMSDITFAQATTVHDVGATLLTASPVNGVAAGGDITFPTSTAFVNYLISQRTDNGGNGTATLIIRPATCGSSFQNQISFESEDAGGSNPPELTVVTSEIYYVNATTGSPAGNNANACTAAAPCATVEHVVENVIADGDIIRVMSSGTTEASTIVCTNQVTIMSNDTSLPTVNFNGNFFVLNAGCQATIKGLTIQSDGFTRLFLENNSSAALTAYSNNFIDYDDGIEQRNSSSTLNLRGNWLGSVTPSSFFVNDQHTTFGDIETDADRYRIGALITSWSEDSSGSSAGIISSGQGISLTKTSGANADYPVVMLLNAIPYGLSVAEGTDCGVPEFDAMVIDGTAAQDSTWDLEIQYGAGCSNPGQRHLYMVGQPLAGGAPDTSTLLEVGVDSPYSLTHGMSVTQTTSVVTVIGIGEQYLYGTGGAGSEGGGSTPLAVGLLSAYVTGEAGMPITWTIAIAFVLLSAVSVYIMINRRRDRTLE